MNLILKTRLKEFILKVILWRPYYTKKKVLCRPVSGFNDILCQIHKCRAYAIRNNRNLWVDTTRSGFHDCLSNYFESPSDFHFGSPASSKYATNSYFPKFLDSQIDSYKSVYDHSIGNHVDEETRTLITFDFNLNYSESVLVHEQCGGGIESIITLSLLRLKPDIKNKIKDIIESLGDYDSIHVRNSDLTTNYKRFFDELKDKVRGKVVVCTDDFECQEYSKRFWGDKLVTTHSIPDTKGKPLHQAKLSMADRYRVNVEVLVDLLILASARNFYKCKTNEGMESGFGLLVESLRSNPRVIKHLLT